MENFSIFIKQQHLQALPEMKTYLLNTQTGEESRRKTNENEMKKLGKITKRQYNENSTYPLLQSMLLMMSIKI